MQVRPLRQYDIEPLFRRYDSLPALMPHHPRVSQEQFGGRLLSSTFNKQPDAFVSGGNIALVTEDGEPVAFGSSSPTEPAQTTSTH
ncbi:MAG: hypothetical protein H8F28_22420 [Fibrella sp.]|nr:hypothetical protein [Armatimonadota bacterium]